MRSIASAFAGVVSCMFVMTVPEVAVAQNVPAGEIAGGYQFMWDNELEESFPAGWFVSGAGNLNDNLAIVGELAGSRKSEGDEFFDASLNVYTYLGGVRFSVPGAVRPFFQFQVGAARATASADFHDSLMGPFQVDESATKFAIQPGGGVDIWLSDALAARVMFDYRRIFSEEGDVGEIRVAAGIVVGFGGR